MDFVGSIKSFIEIFVQRKDRRDDRYDAALLAASLAVNKTRTYLRTHEVNGHDIEKEERLAELWNDASIKLRAIDASLAFACHQKAYYWSNPEADIVPTVRKLDDIHADCVRLLDPSRSELSEGEIISLGLSVEDQ